MSATHCCSYCLQVGVRGIPCTTACPPTGGHHNFLPIAVPAGGGGVPGGDGSTAALPRLPLAFNLQSVLGQIRTAEVPKELALYQNVATGLSTENTAQGIADIICDYRDGQSGVFLVVEAPSGSGKSQLPFTIAKLNIPTVHVVLSSFDVPFRTQKIYQTIMRPSLCIQRAVQHDKFKWMDSAESCGVSSLRLCEDELAVVRVIFYLLGDPAEVATSTTSYTIDTLTAYVAGQPPASLPVFFLDEAMAIDGGGQALRYLRNVFRTAGLLVVLMSSNATGANLVGRMSFLSRENDEPCEWCHVINRLPPCTTDSLAALGWTTEVQDSLRNRGPSWQAFVDTVNSSRSTSNPWFLRTVIETASSIADVPDDPTVSADSPAPTFADIFDQLLGSAAKRIWAAKRGLRTVDGLRAQLCLFLNMYQSIDDLLSNQVTLYAPKASRVFVSQHFAIPTESNYSLYLGEYLETTGSCSLQTQNGKRWDETGPDPDAASFASCSQDPWLHLLLGHLKGMEPFRIDGRSLTTHTAFTLIREQHRLNTDNVVVQSRDGNALEAMGLCALIAASRYDGVAGSTWSNFVLHLATHLVCNEDASVDELLWDWDASVNMESMGSLVQEWVIPFLGPPNSPWPEVLSQTPEICLGNVDRAIYCERVDFTVRGVNGGLSFAGEIKKYEKAVDLTTLEGILQRIPDTSCFHLVMVSRLQKRYGIDWNDTRFRHLAGANVMKVVVVDRCERSLSLAPIFAKRVIPWNKCRALILFVEEAVINGDQVALTVSSSSSNMSAQKRQRVF